MFVSWNGTEQIRNIPEVCNCRNAMPIVHRCHYATTLVFKQARSKLVLGYRYLKWLSKAYSSQGGAGMRLSPRRMHSNTGISSIAGTAPVWEINVCSIIGYDIVDNTVECYKIIYQNPTIYRPIIISAFSHEFVFEGRGL